ncbi:MAG: hypothetical protein K0S47_1068 [Herbinix sp.]|jgi:hypothetical protein|nr:hypothetical protein [Herbinix sp.]
MRKLKKVIAVISILGIVLTGCTTNTGSQTESSIENAAESTTNSNNTSNTDGAEVNNITDTDTASEAITLASSEILIEKEFTARDLEVGYEESTASFITFDNTQAEVTGSGAEYRNGTLTITDEGTYVISGDLSDGQVLVDAEDSDKIQIVFDGVSITNSNNAPVYIKSADKVFITLKEGTLNSLTDGTEYVLIDDNNVDGVIYSKADLTINGSGALTITGNYKHGIATKDDLVITGGTITITALKDAINGKDSVKIKDGNITLSASSGNGIQSKNDEDPTKGYVYICGGTITVTDSQEGMEGTVILIEDGFVDITAKDDGLNAANASTSTSAQTQTTASNTITSLSTSTETVNVEVETISTTGMEEDTDTTSGATTREPQDMPKEEDGTIFEIPQGQDANGQTRPGRGQGGFGGGGEFEADTNAYISISGGTIRIEASGDGIDSNGSVAISGGAITVSGPVNNNNAGLDYNGTADITGGTIIVAGSSGMAQGFSDTSAQYSILNNFETSIAAGTEVTIKDTNGNVVVSFVPKKQYQSVVVSAPGLVKDGTYTITAGDQSAEVTLSSIVTSNGQSAMGGRGNWGGDFTPGEKPKP